MSSNTLIGLINNAALLLALGLLYDIIALRPRQTKPTFQQIFTGFILGGIGLAVMFSPWEFTEGVIFDTRSVLLSTTGLFFGGVPTLIAVIMTALLRIYQGGSGAITGVGVIVSSGLLGLLWRYGRSRDLTNVSNWELYFFGITVHINMLLWMLTLPWDIAMGVLAAIGLPVIIIFPIGNLVLGRILISRLERMRSTQAVQATLNSIDDAVITINEEGQVVLMNPVAETLIGWKLQEASGRNLDDIFQMFDLETGEAAQNPAVQALVENKNGHETGNTLFALADKEGQRYSVEVSASLIRGSENHTGGAVLVFRDVTEKLKTEQELLRISKLESIGVLAGGIAHDFNNLLTGLFGQIALAKMNLSPEHRAYRFIDVAERSLDKAAGLTQQLLTFAKGGEPITQVLRTEEVINEAAVFNLAGSNIKLHVDTTDDLWQIEADKGQISQVISNLVINANQAMAAGGNLYVTAENYHQTAADHPVLTVGCYVKIEIRDEGPGIAAANLDKIFDPYFSTKEYGSGLGLATVHSIVKKHHGHVAVHSVEGEGTTFEIYLPAASGESKSSEPPVLASVEASEPVPASKLLIMDDDETVRDVACKMLAMMGHTTVCTSGGRETIAIYQDALKRNKPFDAVIMDLTIVGGMGGREAVEKILEIDPQARVIVSSGYSTDPVLANYEKYGFKGRVVKPYLPEDLQQVIQTVLQHSTTKQ